MTYILTEILKKANSIADKDEKAEYLSKYMIFPLVITLAAIFNKNIKFEKFRKLRYKKRDDDYPRLNDSKIEVQLNKLHIFQKDNPLPYEEKKKVLEKLLDYLPKEEQELYLNILKKKNPYKTITLPFIKRYFPRVLELDKLDKQSYTKFMLEKATKFDETDQIWYNSIWKKNL